MTGIHSEMIKVWINDSPTTGGHAFRGIGVYTRNLIDALSKNKNIQLVEKGLAQIHHYPYFDLFFNTLHPNNNKSTVVTIHDVIPLIYPQYFKPGLRGTLRFFKQKRTLRQADAIITDSETSKKDIVRFLDVRQEKIYVIRLAPGSSFRKLETGNWELETAKRYSLPERFVLYVGDVNYNKNVEGLIKAFAHLKTKDVVLVLVGRAFQGDSIEAKRILQLIEELSLQDKVVRPGFIKDEDLVKIYNLATVYCQPSFYEGFGLPVLEAMACGLPVVLGRTQALVEIAEGKAIFVAPDNDQEMAQALEDIIVNPRFANKLIRDGLLHVKNFSWEGTASETVEVYKRILNQS